MSDGTDELLYDRQALPKSGEGDAIGHNQYGQHESERDAIEDYARGDSSRKEGVRRSGEGTQSHPPEWRGRRWSEDAIKAKTLESPLRFLFQQSPLRGMQVLIGRAAGR